MNPTPEAPREGHTPGPWIVTRDGYRVVADHPHDLRQVCFTANNNFTRTPEARANARLIAAAPDLLAALEAVKEECDCFSIPNLRRAGHDWVAEHIETIMAKVAAALAKANLQTSDQG